MNLDDALRCLFLRHLRARRLEAEAAGASSRATSLEKLAAALEVERRREEGEYQITLAGRQWRIPEAEFSFYTRGDRPAPGVAAVSGEDAQYERNLANANKWLDTFCETFHA